MTANPGASWRPLRSNGFDYQEWRSEDFRFTDPDLRDDLAEVERFGADAHAAAHRVHSGLGEFPEQELGEMSQHSLDPPHYGFGDGSAYEFDDVPRRLDIEGYGAGLFGGPGADLFGGHGMVDFPEDDVLPPPPPEPEPDPLAESGSLVRPYTRTGGRTRPDYDLAIEALVSTTERGMEREAAVLPEHRAICGLCLEARSVAEIAAHLRLPLGVVRVLIGDMASLGLVVIHQSGLVVGDRPSIEFLERVLSGLRRL